MRLLIVATVITLLFLAKPASAGQFSAEAFISQCLANDLSVEQQQKCEGFFFGLISKKQHLLSPEKADGVVERAMNYRTPSTQYASVTQRTLGVIDICLPKKISYGDFKDILTQHQQRTQNDDFSVNRVTAVLAKAYSC